MQALCAPSARRWWSQVAVAVQHAVASTALGNAWPAPTCASQPLGPDPDQILHMAEPARPSRLTLR